MKKSIYSEQYEALRDAITQARKAAGLTQQQLAKKLGKHQSFVAKYEIGERRLDMVEFMTIAKELGADPIKILKKFQ